MDSKIPRGIALPRVRYLRFNPSAPLLLNSTCHLFGSASVGKSGNKESERERERKKKHTSSTWPLDNLEIEEKQEGSSSSSKQLWDFVVGNTIKFPAATTEARRHRREYRQHPGSLSATTTTTIRPVRLLLKGRGGRSINISLGKTRELCAT